VRQVRNERRTKVRVADFSRSHRSARGFYSDLPVYPYLSFSRGQRLVSHPVVVPDRERERENADSTVGTKRQPEPTATTAIRGTPRSQERSPANVHGIVLAVLRTVVAIARESAFC